MSKKTHLSKFSMRYCISLCVHVCVRVVTSSLVFVLDICACIVVNFIVSTTYNIAPVQQDTLTRTVVSLELGH